MWNTCGPRGSLKVEKWALLAEDIQLRENRDNVSMCTYINVCVGPMSERVCVVVRVFTHINSYVCTCACIVCIVYSHARS